MSDTNTPTPTNSDEFADYVGSGQFAAECFDAEGKPTDKFNEKLGEYVKTVHDKDKDLARQITDQVQKGVRDFLLENGYSTDAPPAQTGDEPTGIKHRFGKTSNRPELYEPRAMGAKIDGKVDNLADFFTAVWTDAYRYDRDIEKLRDEFRNALSSDVPHEGGFLIPEEFRSTLLSVALEEAVVRPRATVIPMGGARVAIPTVDDTTHASGNGVFGGIIAYWTEEAATLTQSEPTFGQVVLDAKKLTTYVVAPNELASDSAISLDALINQLYPRAIAWHEDQKFLDGSGAGEPEGVFNTDAYVSTSAESGQAATTIVWENIVNMYSRMLPSSLNRAVWVAHPDTFPELATMSLSVGTGGSAVWLNNGAAGPPMTILGRPLVFSEHCATLGTVNDLSLIDFGHYLIGDRQAMTARTSEHVAFASDSVAYRIIERIDGRAWIRSAITPANGSNTLSPFVGLATRS